MGGRARQPVVLGRERALDPACGDGRFLRALKGAGFREILGVDVDDRLPLEDFLCGDALRLCEALSGRFDCVATNPPFSAKYGRVTDRQTLDHYELGRGRKSEALEVLFLELAVRALKEEGGVLAIILPEGLFTNLPYRRVRRWLLERVTPLAVIGLSRHFFAAKTCLLLACKTPPKPGTGALLFHAETEEDLPRLKEALLKGEGKRVVLESLIENMSPSFHLASQELPPCPFPLVPLGELLEEIRTGSTCYGEKRRFVKRGLPFLSAKVVTPEGKIDLSRSLRFDPFALDLQNNGIADAPPLDLQNLTGS